MRLSLLLAVLLPSHALANDGFGGLSATGLTFGQTESVAMVEEDLYISPDRIAVEYLFRNTTSQDVTGEIIFPLPPVLVWSSWHGMMNLPDDLGNPDVVNFTATVDGVPVAVTIDQIAVLEEPWDENRPLAAQYDTPGSDVTADLGGFGIPITLDAARVSEVLMALTPDQRVRMIEAGLADFFDGDPSLGIPAEAYGLWSIVTRYHWTQTFPSGADLRIRHTYDNRPSGGLFTWSHPPESYHSYVSQYCIDDGTSRAMARVLANKANPEMGNWGTAYALSYVLRTANSWSGPIQRFKLTLDKGAPGNVVSLCATGIKKTGPTTFVMEKTDFVPDRDLEILLVVPAEY